MAAEARQIIGMWFFSQSTGTIRHNDEVCAVGYSGNDLQGQCKNNPVKQSVKDHGPLPRGRYRMAELVEQHPRLGHYVIVLDPDPANEMWGRSGFCWHGDNPNHAGQSSDGCIVSGLAIRQTAWQGDDHEIEVIQ